MLLVKDISELPETDHPVVLAMGCFDGVHLGHQKVISTAVEQAKERGGEAWVYTFNPHPAKLLVSGKAPPLISAPPCRRRQFETLGLHGVIEIPFDESFAHITPETFLSNLWKKMPSLSGIVCGTDWSFGYKACGKFQTLDALCAKHGITATAISPVLCDRERVSSTRIRKALATGDIPLAERLLGHPFTLFGDVVQGENIGRALGFPTANIEPENELIPADGIYAARTKIQKTGNGGVRTEKSSSVVGLPSSVLHSSAVFIGARKTFDGKLRVIESHLLDFDSDLYGQAVEVRLAEKIRDVHPFPSREALIEQIGRDVAHIRVVLK